MGIITDIIKDIPISAILREKLQELEKKYGEIETDNKKLKAENQTLKKKLEELTKTEELCEDEINILFFLSDKEKLPAEMIANELMLNLTKTKYYLERMDKKYVYPHRYTNRPPKYSLRREGRAYLVENGLM